MKIRCRLIVFLLASLPCLASSPVFAQTALSPTYARDPQQAIDQDYTEQIKKYTTEPYFNSPLTDYLPASKTVPTPAKVLGDVSGAPNMLPYAEDVYKYMRLLAASTPRVKVFTIGQTEEGREMIAVGDRGRGAAGAAEGERRAAGEAGRSADDPPGRQGRGRSGEAVVSDLLHHRHDPLAGDRRADGADGAGVPAGGGRHALHQEHPRAHDHADHAGGGGGRARSHGGHLQVAPGAPERELAAAGLLGPLRRARQQSRRDGDDAGADAERAEHVSRRGRRRCCTICTSRCRFSTTTRSATGRTTRGSIRFWPASGRRSAGTTCSR